MTVGRAVDLVAAFVVWSVLAYMFIFLFAGTHVCGILQPVAPTGGGPAPTPNAAFYAAAQAACDRPDIGAIAVFATGYVGLAVAAIWRWRTPIGRP